MNKLKSHRSDASTQKLALTPFGIGIGVHLDTHVDSMPPDPSAISFMRELGLTRYRLNVQWNAVFPRSDGAVDYDVLDRLGAAAERLLDAGIEPLIAFDNTALPVDIEADGGWLNLATVRAYSDFVGAVGARLGDLVDQWIVLATTHPHNFAPSMMPNFVAAQIDAATILRAHVPHASIGTAIDASQFDTSLPPASAQATQVWLAHLASSTARANFVSINGGRAGTRSPAVIAQWIRALASNLPGYSFVLTEARSTPGSRRSEAVAPTSTGLDRYDIGFALADEVRQLRSEQIDVSGVFVWPFAKATAAVDELTEAAIERCRRINAAGID